MHATTDGADWLEEAAAGKYLWTRIGSAGLEAEIAPGLPCRVSLERRGEHPVLYVAIGTNGAPDYWQWASVDMEAGEPLPKEEALARMRDIIELASITSKSSIKSQPLTP